MSDLFRGQTCTEQYQFISAGTVHTFDFNFQADKVVFNNLTQWAGVAGNLPKNTWFRNQTAAGQSYQQQVIDSAAASSFNFVNLVVAGFTVADTEGGVEDFQALIFDVLQADPCVITTIAAHGYQTNQLVRITDLGSDMPVVRGMDQINNLRFRIVVLTPTTFSLKDPITDDFIDSTSFTAYVTGGRVDLETRVLALNHPQVDPYSNTNPYQSNPFAYDPILYRLTADTGVMGDDGDVFNIEVIKYGQVTDLGDLLT